MTPSTIAAPDMEALLGSGQARPLLEDHFPVPVQLAGRWWHVPDEPPPGVPAGAFVAASPGACAEYERLLARRLAAARLLDPGRSGAR